MSTDLEITELAPLLRERKVSPDELTRAYLERIERLDPRLNAYITVTARAGPPAGAPGRAEIAAGAWRGPLHGVPLGIKDLFDVAGVPNTLGSKILRDNVAQQDATVVARLKQAGAVILGKHNLHEFAFGITSENPHYGAVRNPWDLDRVPGRLERRHRRRPWPPGCAPAGIGSDTGASIRAPASFCGIVGLKPTYGRVSRAGALPLAWSLDHAGPMARSVADCALMLQAIAGYDPRDPGSADCRSPTSRPASSAGVDGLRMGVPREYFFDLLEPDVERLVREAIARLGGLGARSRGGLACRTRSTRRWPAT